MSDEELKSILKYLKNKNNTRRIKTITINEAQKVVEEIERLNKIIGHALGYIECANKVDITYVCKILKGEIDKE